MAGKKDSTKALSPAHESRRERRKRETRKRLLRAAMTLMATSGKEGIAIKQITEAADVGFGSFYNYFESKEDIYNQLIDEFVDTFGDALNRISEFTDDPAEILAASIRLVLVRVENDFIWGRFLIRFAFSAQVFSQRFGMYFLRDVQLGFTTGRFRAADPMMAITSVGGTILAAAMVAVELPDGGTLTAQQADPVHLDKSSLPERTAAVILQILGLEEADAVEVANRLLPDIYSVGDPDPRMP